MGISDAVGQNPMISAQFQKNAAALGVLCFFMAGCGGPNIGDGAGSSRPSTTNIYVTQFSGTSPNQTSTILRFEGSYSGNVTPSAAITPPAGFEFSSVATDSMGTLYASAVSSNGQGVGEILEYAGGASGGAVPTRVIAGSSTLLSFPQGIALDASSNIYAVTLQGTVLEFSATASDNVAPMRSITGTGGGFTVAADSTGNVYVGGFTSDAINVYGPTASGSATPIRVIFGSNTLLGIPVEMTLDSSGNLYVASLSGNGSTDGVLVFGSGANGNIAPTRTIRGAATGFNSITGMALDSAGRIYEADVANFTNSTGPSVNVFAAGANGNAAPVSNFTSGSWNMTGMSNIAVF